MSFDITPNLEGWLIEAGFINVKMEEIKVPVGGKTLLGQYNLERLHRGVFDFSARILSTELKAYFPDTHLYYALMLMPLSGPPSIELSFLTIYDMDLSFATAEDATLITKFCE